MIARLGERQSENEKVRGSIPSRAFILIIISYIMHIKKSMQHFATIEQRVLVLNSDEMT